MTGQFTAIHGITDWIGALSREEWCKKNKSGICPDPSYEYNLFGKP
ncbi:hypothetical protein [Maribacter luteus]|nr:hypothetical protein [Maribacter luteus]